MRRFGLIYNPRAGRGWQAGVVHATAADLRARGYEALEYECPGDPADPVARALADQCSVIVACGGDGTVSGVAAALFHSSAVLGVLPLGTLNHFAKDLGVSDIGKARSVLLEGNVREIDTGMVNGRTFINNSGIGIYPAMVFERERVRKRGIPKWPAFILACFKALAKMPFLRLHLEADGRRLARVTPFLFVGNNLYEIEGLSVGRRKRLDGGVLEICTARHSGPLGLIRIAFRALTGHLREDRDFTLLTAKALTVQTRRRARLRVSLDGELHRMKLPLEYSIVPRALRVLAP